MANTVTQTTLVGSGAEKVIVRHIYITSDGTQETNTIVYDNSAFVADVTKGKLVEVTATGADCQIALAWDQTADFKVISINPIDGRTIDLRPVGGIRNPAGAGATGDLLMSTIGLGATEEVTLIITIHQN